MLDAFIKCIKEKNCFAKTTKQMENLSNMKKFRVMQPDTSESSDEDPQYDFAEDRRIFRR